ncbi:polymer-forming cytoskeletal protein [Cupriavidus sp. WKF15]|uniref:polymer-forming cytoskeletal protein n=1 Tax=Cupriavidus sp. WKF15 TaxID=3032282 RepID=UPI0023E26301|nr:polymer-forming cytoskeletal protein [Cupriavidus sp. WKF15]WER47976.1 polymer-forming cytoskeletal protein [Cupriavidus sp. WKF15]
MWLILLTVLTLLAFSLPLVPAFAEWRRPRDILPLAIDGEHTLDVCAVAAEFRAMLDTKAGAAARAGAFRDQVLKVGSAWTPTSAEHALRRCDRVVIAQGDLELPDHFTFRRELYAKRNLSSGVSNCLLAVLAEGGLLLRQGSVLQHWAHARHARVEPHCSLEGPLSAWQEILIEDGCEFTALTASAIRFGNPDNRDGGKSAVAGGARPPPLEQTERAGATSSDEGSHRIIEHDYLLAPGIRHDGDLIVHGDLRIGTAARITGSVKATGSIRLEDHVRIDGALVCGSALFVAPCCAIMGPVIAEESVSIAENCLIGLLSRPTSLAAPEVCVWRGTTVHGAVSAIVGGRAMPAAMAAPCDEHD